MEVWPIQNFERDLAHGTAVKRQLASRAANLKIGNYWRSDTERFHDDFIGALAEIVWAHWNGRTYHNPINEFHHIPDDGTHEIRASAHPAGGLIIRDNDPTHRKYVFIQIDTDHAVIWGWAYGWEVRKPEFEWNPGEYRQAWRIPRNRLRNIRTIEKSPDHDHR